MTAREANDKGYRIGNHSFEEDVENFITDVEVMTVGEKTTVVNDLWAHLGFVLQWAKYGLKK